MIDNIKQTQKNVKDLADNIKQLATIFNGASDKVTSDINEMGVSFSDLRKQINELANTSDVLSKKLNLAIDKNNTKMIEDYINEFKKLDSEMEKLSGVINSHITEMNKAFSGAFDTTLVDSLKSEMNDLAAEFAQVGNGVRKLSSIRPDLSNFANDFIKQTDIIENEMGRLTRYGSKRSEIEKALGFTINRYDISSELEDKQSQLSSAKDELNKYFGGVNISKLKDADKEFYKELSTNVKNIEQAIKALDSSVGQKVTGYIELFNKANNLMSSGKVNRGLIEEIAHNPFSILSYDQMKSITPTEFNKMISVPGNIDEDTQVSKVEAVNNAVKEQVKEYDELSDKLKEILSLDNTLSAEAKQQIISNENINKKVEDRKKILEYVKSDLAGIANISLNKSATPIELVGANGIVELTNYKARIDEAVESVKLLKAEQEETSAKLSTKSGLLSSKGVKYNTYTMNSVKDVLESGYRVNIKQGTEAYDKLKLIEETFNKIIDGYKNTRVAIVDDKDIENAVKIRNLEEAIAKEKNNQAKQEQAQALYEADKLKYLELQRQSAEKQRAIVAYQYMMQRELNGVTNEAQKKAIINKYDSKRVFDIKTQKYTGKDGLITQAKNDKATINKQIESLQAKFNKYKLEIPVVTKMDNIKPAMSDADTKKYWQYKTDDVKQFKSEMSRLEQDTSKLSSKAVGLNIDVSKLVGRLNAVGNSAKTAFNTGNIERVNLILNEYRNILGRLNDKVVGSTKAREIAVNQEANSYKRLFNEVKNYVSTQEILSGKKMPLQQQIEYYKSALSKFNKDSQEYIAILALQRQAEQNLARETELAERKRVSAIEQASQRIKQAQQQVMSTLQSAFAFINQTVNKIVSIIRTSVNLVIKLVTGVVKVFVGIKDTITRLIGLFGNFGNRMRGLFGGTITGSNSTNNSFNILKGTATELRSKILLLKGAFDLLFNNQFNKQAMTLYQSVYSLKNIVGSDLTQDTIDWANSMERAFGISAKGLISDLNELSGVLYGLGMRAEHVAVGAQNILMISRYLAFMGAAGGDVKVVMDKLNSGMKGMTQSVDDLGLSVREAQMDYFLKKLKAQGGEFANIGTSFANLNEEARVYIRYASLIQQFTSKYNMTDLAKTFDTVTGRLTILTQRIQSLGTTIGQIFVKLASAIAPYVTYIVTAIEQGVQRLANLIGSLTGIDMNIEMSQKMNDSANSADELTGSLGNVEDELKKVEKQSKKTNNSLFDSDRLNNVVTKTDSGSSADEFDYSKLMTSALDGLNQLAKEANASYLDKLKDKFNTRLSEIKESILKFSKDITGRTNFDIGFDTVKFKSALSEATEYTGKFIKNIASLIAEFTLKIADDINIGNIVVKITELFAQLAKTINTIVEVSAPGLRKFYDIALKPIIEALGILLADRIKFIIDMLNKLGTWFTDNQETVTNWFVNIANKFTELKGMLLSAITGNGFKFVDENTTGVLNQVLNIIRSISEVGKVLLTQVIVPLLQSFVEFAKNELIPWLTEKLKELSAWISNNSDKIVEFIKYIAREIYNLVKIIVEKLAPVVGWLIEHPQAIKAALIGLMSIKIISWIGNLAIGIWKAVEAFKGLKGALSGLKGLKSVFSGVKGVGGLFGGAKTAVGGILGGAKTALTGTAGKALLGAAPIAAGIAGIGIGIVDAVKSIGRTEEMLGDNKLTSKISAGIGGFFGGQGKGVTDENRTTGQKVGSIALNTAKGAGIGAAIGSIIPGVGTAVGAAVGGGVGLIGGLIGGDNIAKALKDFNTFVTDQIKKIPDVISKVTSTIGSTFQNIANTTSDTFSNITTNALENFKNVGSKALDTFNELGTKGFEVFNNLSSKFFETVSNVLNGASKVFNNITSNVSESLSNVVRNVMNTFSNIGTSALNAFNNIANGVMNIFSNISAKVYETFSNIANSVVNIFSSIASNVANTLSNVINKIVNVFNDIKTNAFNFIKNTASKFIDNAKVTIQSTASKFGITKIPGFASGGTVRSGQLFVANENGSAELIGNFGMGGTSVANSEQIMDAMKSGIFEAVYNAIAEFASQGFFNNTGSVKNEFNFNGTNILNSVEFKKWVLNNVVPILKAGGNKIYNA